MSMIIIAMYQTTGSEVTTEFSSLFCGFTRKELSPEREIDLCGVCTGPRKPGKSWNFIVAFSRTESSAKKLMVLEIC